MDSFKDKTLLITGGTGSFGNAVLERFLNVGLKEIRIFSRDEKKQDDMRHRINNPMVKFYIGDVRDKRSVDNVMHDVDFIFHAAALKQVPSCEFFPIEAVRTNVLGTENVIDSAVEHGVKRVITLSTDKAVYPINAMGISKAMMEKVMVAKSRNLNGSGTVVCGTRYGNVMASRGSVIPLFIDQINSGKELTVTDPEMTRFMMTLEDAVDLVLYAFKHGKNGDIFVQKAPAATIGTLAEAVLEIMMTKAEINTGPQDRKTARPQDCIKVIGTRHGEKLWEVLVSREEMAKASDLGEYYRIPCDTRDLNYDKYFDEGEKKISLVEDYTSHNTARLDKDGMKKMLLKLDIFKVKK